MKIGKETTKNKNKIEKRCTYTDSSMMYIKLHIEHPTKSKAQETTEKKRGELKSLRKMM